MRRAKLGGRTEAVLYAVAGSSYIAAGIAYKGLLNWVVGPLWVVAVVEIGARVADARSRHDVGDDR